MAVPKRKTSPMKRGFRRSADALKAPTYVEDKESGERRRPHHIDLKSGKYRGRQILEPKTEVSSKAAAHCAVLCVAAQPIASCRIQAFRQHRS